MLDPTKIDDDEDDAPAPSPPTPAPIRPVATIPVPAVAPPPEPTYRILTPCGGHNTLFRPGEVRARSEFLPGAPYRDDEDGTAAGKKEAAIAAVIERLIGLKVIEPAI